MSSLLTLSSLLSSPQAKLGRRLSARVISLLSPSKEKSKKESELVAPTETATEGESSTANADKATPSATSDEAPSVTTEIPAGSLITASTPIVPESATSEEKETATPTTTAAPPTAPVVAGESTDGVTDAFRNLHKLTSPLWQLQHKLVVQLGFISV